MPENQVPMAREGAERFASGQATSHRSDLTHPPEAFGFTSYGAAPERQEAGVENTAVWETPQRAARDTPLGECGATPSSTKTVLPFVGGHLLVALAFRPLCQCSEYAWRFAMLCALKNPLGSLLSCILSWLAAPEYRILRWLAFSIPSPRFTASSRVPSRPDGPSPWHTRNSSQDGTGPATRKRDDAAAPVAAERTGALACRMSHTGTSCPARSKCKFSVPWKGQFRALLWLPPP